METIDLTPTWQGLMPGLIAALQNAKAPKESHDVIREELHVMANAAGNTPVIVDNAIMDIQNPMPENGHGKCAKELLYQLARNVDDQIASREGGA